MYGQLPRVGIKAARISTELRNKIWKEDDLLKELRIGGDDVFLDPDPDVMGTITTRDVTRD